MSHFNDRNILVELIWADLELRSNSNLISSVSNSVKKLSLRVLVGDRENILYNSILVDWAGILFNFIKLIGLVRKFVLTPIV